MKSTVLIVLLAIALSIDHGNSVFIDLTFKDDGRYGTLMRNPPKYYLTCNYDYEGNENIQNVYFYFNDKLLYTNGEKTSFKPKWESTNIKVSDPSCVPDQSCGWDKEKTTLYFHNTTRHAFGDYRCKVDYWSDADMKAHEHDSHTSVTVGRKENGTFFITYNAEQHYSNRPLP